MKTERQEFLAVAKRNYPDVPKVVFERLIRLAARYNLLAEQGCNGCTREKHQFESWEDYDRNRTQVQIPLIETRQLKIEKVVEQMRKAWNLKIELGGDPRGYCMKIHFPDGAYNTWGGQESGYGIPA